MPGEHRPGRSGFLSFLGGLLTVVASSGGRGSVSAGICLGLYQKRSMNGGLEWIEHVQSVSPVA